MDAHPKYQTGSFPAVVLGQPIEKLSGLETLDLAVAEPEATTHLKLAPSQGARFQAKTDETSYGDAWQLSADDKGLQLELQLPYKHGVVLILEMVRTQANAHADQPVILAINGHDWQLEIDPHNLNFHKQSWYLPHYRMRTGENILSLRLAPTATTEVLVKAAAVMRFEIEEQGPDNWCWAAVTNSLLQFFGYEKLPQCQIVKECFKATPGYQTETDCCQQSEDAKCDREYDLADALDLLGMLSSCCNYPLTLDEIREQINQGAPVAARIAWRGGGAHFVVITAVVTDPKDDTQSWLRVANPKDQAASYEPYQMFLTKYKGIGTWTHSYLFEKERQRTA